MMDDCNICGNEVSEVVDLLHSCPCCGALFDKDTNETMVLSNLRFDKLPPVLMGWMTRFLGVDIIHLNAYSKGLQEAFCKIISFSVSFETIKKTFDTQRYLKSQWIEDSLEDLTKSLVSHLEFWDTLRFDWHLGKLFFPRVAPSLASEKFVLFEWQASGHPKGCQSTDGTFLFISGVSSLACYTTTGTLVDCYKRGSWFFSDHDIAVNEQSVIATCYRRMVTGWDFCLYRLNTKQKIQPLWCQVIDHDEITHIGINSQVIMVLTNKKSLICNLLGMQMQEIATSIYDFTFAMRCSVSDEHVLFQHAHHKELCKLVMKQRLS